MTEYQSEAGNNALLSERKIELGFKTSMNDLTVKTTKIGGRSLSINTTENKTDDDDYRIKSFS